MFDPYHRWLGIPTAHRPPTHYQLLGIAADETDPEVIQEAALRQTSHVRLYQTGPYATQATTILNEIGQARAVLLNPEKRRLYDASLGPSTQEVPPPMAEVELVRLPLHTPALPPLPPLPRWPLAANDAESRDLVRRRGRARDGTLWPALGFAALLLLGAGLAFGVGLARSAGRPEPPPRPVTPAPTDPAPAPRPATRGLLEGHEGAISALAIDARSGALFSAGGSHATGDPLDCAWRRWDLRSGKAAGSFPAHQAPIRCLALSPDSQQLLTGGGGCEWRDGELVPIDCVVRLWDLDGKQGPLTFAPHKAPISGLAFLRDGHRVVSCGCDGSVLVWDVRSDGLPQPLTEQGSPALCLSVTPAGRFLVVGGLDGQIRLWDLATRQEFDRFPRSDDPVSAVSFSPSGRQVVTGGGRLAYRDGKAVPVGCAVRLWDRDSGNLLHELAGHTRPIRGLAWARDGRTIASGALDGTVRLWDARAGKGVLTLRAGSAVTCVVFTPNRRLVAGTMAGVIRVWDLDRELVRGEQP